MSKFQKLFAKPEEPFEQASVSFMLPGREALRVHHLSQKLGTTASAIYRSLITEALPLLEAEVQRREDAGELL